VRLLHLVEYEEGGEKMYFEKKFKIEKECLDMTIIDEDGSYDPDETCFDAATGEVVWRMETDQCADKEEFNECLQEVKGNGWRLVENLPPRLKDLFK
jgi:hypothetical protein